MAEGFARKLLPGCEIHSAGLEPKGVHPLAIRAMAEVGIDISHQTSKPIDPDLFFSCDIVVTLCGDADERCPAVPPGAARYHWPLPDPAKASGSEEEVMQVFRNVRDQIRDRVAELAHMIEAQRGNTRSQVN